VKKSDLKKFSYLISGIPGAVLTAVRVGADGQVFFKYRIPARVIDRQRRAAHKADKKADKDDIGQGEGCEGGKCEVRR
jgi:hypothetical protein